MPGYKLKQCLQVIFGRTNALREVIDKAIEQDDKLRRKKCMRYLRPPKRFPAPEEMDNEETATWIRWIHQETHALLEDLNEEARLQSDMDDPFTKDVIYATGDQLINEISPKDHTQQPEEKPASPLPMGRVNLPLPQRIHNRCGEIPPEHKGTRDLRGKPLVHNMRNNNTRRQINYDNVQWEGNDTSYLQLLNMRQQIGLEQFSLNDTTDIRLCHRCRGEGHIRKYCNINIHCDFSKSYSHHTSVCRSYANFVRAHPMASSRRTSPAHMGKQNEWTQPTVEMERTETTRQQKYDELPEESDPARRRDISEITHKHLERVISTIIPSSTCSSSDPTENVPMNSLATQPCDKELEKQVIFNNYYIKDKEEGWKQVKVSEIPPNYLKIYTQSKLRENLPNGPKTYTQNKQSEILPHETMMEATIDQTLKNSENLLMYTKKETEMRPNTRIINEQQRFYTAEPEKQNMTPPITGRYNYPPPTGTERGTDNSH